MAKCNPSRKVVEAFLLGGTGFLGQGIQGSVAWRNSVTVAFSSKQCNSRSLVDSAKLVQLVRKIKPRYVVDFTRNAKDDLLALRYILQLLPHDMTYVNISSYGVDHPDVYLGQEEYNQTKLEVEKMARACDYSIRLPLIVPDTGLTQQLVDDIDGDHVWICQLSAMCQFLWETLHEKQPGMHICPGEYVDLQQWKMLKS